MENKTVTVRMEKEKPQNLTCIKPLEKYNIQWRKVEFIWQANRATTFGIY